MRLIRASRLAPFAMAAAALLVFVAAFVWRVAADPNARSDASNSTAASASPRPVQTASSIAAAAPALLREASRAIPSFADTYELVGDVPWTWPGAEVELIFSGAPLRVSAEILARQPLPARWREVSRGLRWNATDGRIVNDTCACEGAPAIWTPPTDSKLVRLTAEAWVRLEPDDLVEIPAPVNLTFKKEWNFLTSISSASMKDGKIDGYSIGEFPKLPKKVKNENLSFLTRYPERYAPPSRYFKMEASMKSLRVSSDLPLGAFMIDFPWGSLGSPQYVAVDPHLIRKLETIIDMMRADGYRVTTFTPIYGFRPPSFNLGSIKANPNTTLKVTYSMHQFGRAFDFIIDEDGDLRMDDLNADGRIDLADSRVIMQYVDVIDRLHGQIGDTDLIGGAGLYDHHDFKGRKQTPYIHVDTRGFLGMNGLPIRWIEY